MNGVTESTERCGKDEAMKAVVETITPMLAEKYLERNVNNYRSLNRRKVHMYARDMANNEWQENGEAIKFNVRGELVDGQHRLHAVIESGARVNMMVIRGVAEDVTIYDCGKNRSMRDIALAEGIESKLAENFMTGAAACIVMGDARGYKAGSTTQYPTKGQIAAHIIKHRDLWMETYNCMTVSHSHSVTRKSALCAAVYFLLAYGEDPWDIRDFMEIVETGFPITGRDCSPAIVLRNMIIVQPKTATRELYFSALVDAFYDFKNHRPRRKVYTAINQKTINALKELSEMEK